MRFIWAFLCLGIAPATWGQSFVITTHAGAPRLRDNSPAISAPLRAPRGVAIDRSGNVFIADTSDNRVRRVSPSGTITTYAGNGVAGFSGDGGQAINARLSGPRGLAVDAAGNLYIADYDNLRVRKVAPDGGISTVAGSGTSSFGGDNGPALAAGLDPIAVAVDAGGTVYIADYLNSRIRKVNPAGTISTFAGTGSVSGFVEGGPAASSTVGGAAALALDAAGNLYVADNYNEYVRKITPAGAMTTVVGNGQFRYSGDGAAALSAAVDPAGVAVDAAGNLYIGDEFNDRIRKVTPAGVIQTLAGNGQTGFGGDGSLATNGQLADPGAIAVDASGVVVFADQANLRVRRVDAQGTLTTIGGTGLGDGAPAVNSFLSGPSGLSFAANGSLLVADSINQRIRRITPDGTISTIVGNGLPLAPREGVAGTGTTVSLPFAVAADPSGNILFGDSGYSLLRQLSATTNTVTTRAGQGKGGFGGDGGQAKNALLNVITALAYDAQGNLYLADYGNARVRKIDTAGVISTIAGNGTRTASGDGGPAKDAGLDPFDVAIDASGNLYIADTANQRIRLVTPSGLISTVLGTGVRGFAGDGGLGSAARLNNPQGVAVDAAGNLYVADRANGRIRRLSTTGVVTTVAGNGAATASGDGGLAALAGLDPIRLAFDRTGNLYVADISNDRIRKLAPISAATASVVSGDRQTGATGQAATQPLVVKVVTNTGQPAPAVSVTFAVTSGSAAVTPPTAVTGVDGTASASVTFGAIAGPVTITATPAGLTPVTFTLTAVAAATTPLPRISAGGVISAGFSVPAIRAVAPNAVFTIFGENFAPAGTLRQAGGSDYVNGRIPLTLAGVCVQVGTQRAPIFLVTPTQVNFQVPAITGVSAIAVQVIVGCGTATETRSNAESVAVQAAAPEFLSFAPSTTGNSPIAAVNAVTNVYAARAGLLPGATFVPAKPGDILTLYAVGLGATDPVLAAGEIPAAIAAVTGQANLTIGGVPVQSGDLFYVGISPGSPGLYQINLRIPANTPEGDQPVVLTVNGFPSAADSFLTVQR